LRQRAQGLLDAGAVQLCAEPRGDSPRRRQPVPRGLRRPLSRSPSPNPASTPTTV
jgi:hypothetical protein